MADSYSNLSKFYEKIILDKEYEKWVQSTVLLLKKYVNFGEGIDCACGSGIFTRALKRAGYDVIGVDISNDMLSQAVKNNAKYKVNIEYQLQDIKNLKSFKKVDFITVFNDGLNYVSQGELVKTFKNFKKSLKNNGVLIFDFSSEYKLKNVLSNNMFGDNGDDLSYLWLNEYNEENNRVDMALTFFEKQGEKYLRYDDFQSQYIHALKDVENSLNLAGFDILKISDINGEELKKSTQKIQIIAKSR